MKKSNKITTRAYKVVKAQGQGSFSRLAEALGKSTANTSQILRNGKMSLKNSYLFTDAINATFGTNYTREELITIP